MFIIDLIKAFKKGSKKEENKIPVKEVEVDFNRLPKDTQDWIRKMYDKKNEITEECVAK